MGRIMVFCFLIVVACASALDTLEVLPRVGITNFEENGDAFFTSMAGVPLFVFHYGGNVYQSPYLTDDLSDTAVYLLEDFNDYITPKGGVEQVVFIGSISAGVRTGIENMFPNADVVEIGGGDVPRAARTISSDWEHAARAVLAIYGAPTDEVRLAVANAAGVAGYLNVPLLFVEENSVPEDTFTALGQLGAEEVIIVDPGDLVGPGAEAALTDAGITIAENLTTIQEVVSFMREESGIVALNTFTDYDQTFPAAISAARYGGFSVELDLSAKQGVIGLDNRLKTVIGEMPTEKFPLGEWEPPIWLPSGEGGIADDFLAWLEYLGAEDPNQLEWVTFFGPKSDMGVELERAIVGDPAEPNQPGCLPGRMPGDPKENVVYINRSGLYPAVLFANPYYDRAIYAYNNFICHYADQGPLGGYDYDFQDNNGVWRRVNELLGVPEFGEMGVWEALDDAGYDYACHAGVYEGWYPYPGGDDDEHPFNPPGQTLDGFVEYINAGGFLYYYSGHGSTSSISASRVDFGITEEVPYDHPYWPAEDGRITSFPFPVPSGYNQNEWNNDLENIRSLVSTWDTCLVGASYFNEYTMEHGGAGSMSSYISVSWEGSGWYWCLVAEYIARGYTMAECLGYGLANTSDIFPQDEYGSDGTLYYLWYGDPFLVLYQPGWTSPDPADLYADYGGHKPGRFLDVSVRDFRGEALAGAVKLSWKVTAGTVAGFNLYRHAMGGEGPAVGLTIDERINEQLITGPTPYVYWDEKVKRGITYGYVLEAVGETGTAEEFGPIYVTAGDPDVPNALALYQSYPNPTSGPATISFAVPHECQVTIAVYDIAGRRVGTVVDRRYGPGTYELEVSGFAPGVYTYCMYADGAVVGTRKMVVLAE